MSCYSVLLSISFLWKKALALTVDGQGDGFFSKLYVFDEKAKYQSLGSSKATPFGKQGSRYLSVGRIYEHFTQAMDLRVGSDEGKVEALAAFGKADKDLLAQLKAATK